MTRLECSIKPRVVQSLLVCAEALESVDADEIVSRACVSWAQSEYEDFSHDEVRSMTAWVGRTIVWAVEMLKVRNAYPFAGKTSLTPRTRISSASRSWRAKYATSALPPASSSSLT